LDQADGSGQIEDANKNLFQVESSMGIDSSLRGKILNGRLQNQCSISFYNGDKFIGIFKDGRPNGKGTITYKNSVVSLSTSVEFEGGVYEGDFRNGRREG